MPDSKFFISYSRKDGTFVLKLAEQLRAASVSVWLDQLDIAPGQRWDSNIEKALDECGSMLIVLSPESVTSESVLDEVSFALEEKKTILPIRIQSCKIPFRLRRLQHVDFTGDYDTAFAQLLKALKPTDTTDQLVDPDSDYRHGKALYEAKNYAASLPFIRKAAEQGNAEAQNDLSFMYAEGFGVEKDDEQAVSWYTKAAEQGNAKAQYNLGIMYKNGWGVGKDYQQAVSWYTKAVEKDFAAAQYYLGIMYKNGWGVEKDDEQAVSWYTKAAEQGYADAQYNLGIMYAEGFGVEKDYKQAVNWYRKAAEQGYTHAQVQLKALGEKEAIGLK